MKYRVEYSIVSLVNGKYAQNGDELADSELEGLDVGRLVEIGAISAVQDVDIPLPPSKGELEEVDILPKAGIKAVKKNA